MSSDSVSFPSGFVEFPGAAIEQSIPQRLEELVHLYPNHLAVKTRQQELTYADFNRSANRLARAVVAQSSHHGAVAILLEHDAAAIVAIFAVLKAAKYFLPLDTSIPKSRMGYMLEDSEVEILITNDQFYSFSRSELGANIQVINMDALGASFGPENLGLSIAPQDLSCVLYTSGTTGQPKGVLHTHRNEIHNVRHHTNSLHLGPQDRLTLLGSYSTGQGMQDLYCALLNGATLVPWSLKVEGLSHLADWLISERITVYHSAATVFRHFVRILSGNEQFPFLRIIRLGSEQVSWKDVDLFKEHFSNQCLFVNALSSSETKTIRQYVLDRESPVGDVVPVGYPVQDMDVCILDESRSELPCNEIGEIAVRSKFLSPGYIRNPELTSAKYLSDPSDPEKRLFLTGEWGRLSTDGCLHHLGRKDAQVKIRGYRVEISETELALLKHPAVDQALITSRENKRGDKYLVAYIVPARGANPTVSDLREFLTAKIPHYMEPSAYVFLESLPLTANGKIDRAALPEPARVRPPVLVAFVAPTHRSHERLANLWADVLDIAEAGIDDNFFDLGGNSILAMQVAARIEREFHIDLPLRRVFEFPTVRLLSRELSRVGTKTRNTAIPRVPSVTDSQKFPLSWFQQRLWFLNQWAPGQPLYTICRAYKLVGAIESKWLERGLNLVIARHDMLRTTFQILDDQPTQTVAPSLSLHLDIVELQDRLEHDRQAEGLRLIDQAARQLFDLSVGPLLSARLIKLADQEYLFFVTVHQIICDGWSMSILLRELWTFYEACAASQIPALPEPTVQYGEFTLWQRRFLSDEFLQPQLEYWKKILAGQLAVLELPTDRAHSHRQTFRGARRPLVLSESRTEALGELSRRNDVTLFMTLMTAYTILLHRYSGQDDVIVGFPIANRNWADTAGVIGFFVNTLVLRADLSGNPTFTEHLARVREACVGAYANQDLPFEKLVNDLAPRRDISRNPIFQTLFTFQSMPSTDLSPQSLRLQPVEVDSGTSKFDLTLSLVERDKKLSGSWEYSTDLFDASTIERLAGHFEMLLDGILGHPEQPVSALALFNDQERQRILVNWNETEAAYPQDCGIPELFVAQVQRTPNRIALEFGAESITYRDLDRKSNRLARYLVGLGFGSEGLFGIYLERSIDMVIALLGILKAGAAYVPLDPSYPEERLRFMMEDARISIIVTQARLLANLQYSACTPKCATVCMDRDDTIIQRHSSEALNVKIHPDSLAYVIYTSGSTGTPKGVCGPHRAAVNRMSWMWTAYPFRPNEKGCIKTTLSFVDSVWEIFGPLLQGVPSVIIPELIAKDSQLLVRTLAETGVSRIVLVPSMLRAMLDTTPALQAQLPELTLWSLSGERLSKPLLDRARASLPNSVILNLYGCTEVAADVTCFDTRDIAPDCVTIGRPISNTQIYILDSHQQPVPIGATGEILVGGVALARGYLNCPELTKEKFISHPFKLEAETPLYRTGDLARYLPDGNIEFLGRRDGQVKIRGHRIELSEIENILNQHPAVRESVVVARDRDLHGEKELVGYVVFNHGSQISLTELRRFLQAKLPDYMVPSFFVFLETLPLTPNGKIDRNALPPADGERPQLDQGFVEPRTEIEELIAQVWREVLKLDKIGIHDNFFELGGHSLLATRVIARLRSSFNVDIALRKLFELPTVAGLAQHIDYLRRSGSGAVIAPIVPVDRAQTLPLSFSQRRLWYLQKVDTNLSAYNIPAAFCVKGDLDSAALARALNEMIGRHEVLRSYVKEINGQPRQEILPSLRIALPVIDLTRLTDEQAEIEARRLFSADARQLYNLATAPLMRATLVKLAVDNHVLILNFHHIIADGSSLAIFYKELAALYDAARDSKTASLPSLPVQYTDYAAWQQDWLKSSSFDTQLSYWKQQLAGLPEPCALPTDFDRPMLPTYRGARLAIQLSDELTGSLKNLNRRQSVTMFMTLLATLNVLLSRISGQEDIVMGSTIAGRNHPETDGLIGFFINAVPLRTDLCGEPSFVTLLRRVRELCLDAYTNQDVPFEKIVEATKPRREPGRNPIFDILFNIADISERTLTLTGCEVTKLGQVDPAAKFDIVLHAPEVNGKIELAIVYNTALFHEGRITLLLEQFASLLAQVVVNPELPIGQLSLVTDASRTVLPDPKAVLDDSWEGAIHEWLAEQARRSPANLALVDPEQTWTYAELDRCANQLANSLNASSIEPNDLIAIYAHRSSSLVVALFGILKAGASFLILDPAYPAARSIDYLRIARPKGWLRLEGSGELPDELLNCLDSLQLRCRINVPQSKAELLDNLSAFTDTEPATIVTADDPAYVAFTSGSTGEPKGVVCRHGPITHFLPWQKEAFQLREADRFAMLSGLAYSHLHRDVFTALSLGATLYIPNPSEASSPEHLARWLQSNAVTVLHLTPALGQLLLTSGDARLPSVRRVFFGGDVLTTDMVARIRRLAPNATVGSFYGATETQRAVGYFEIANDTAAAQVEAFKTIALGRGIKDVQLLVLNRSQQLAGVGELGEIFVRSPHLAAKYINDEKRTEQMFLANPFTNDANDRLYRTGELGRYLPAGNVEWAGRNDRRVNIRGFRIELEEVEIALKQHPTVKDAAVVLSEVELPNSETPKSESSDNRKSKIQNPKSDPRLVAYVAADEEPQSLADLLQSYLSTRLPHYMVPAHFVILPSLPPSPNGKVDYRSLPAMQFSASVGTSTAPRDEVENKLCEIFAELLGRSEVGTEENFFRIGGHSLLAARAAARIGDAFGVNLDLSTFLENPTVSGLAKKLDSLRATGQTSMESDKDQREEFDL